jgi:2-polyprenyl-6-hydroxyphenyl methylase/3-demethylubiquinone-9 3-methyltransferase
MMGCFEVLEHVIDPVASLRRIVEFLAPDGFLMISTLVQGEAFVAQGLDWWYVAPRNGHVSIHSPQSLNRLWNGAGFRLTTLSQNTHVAWRRVPPFAAHLPHFFRG